MRPLLLVTAALYLSACAPTSAAPPCAAALPSVRPPKPATTPPSTVAKPAALPAAPEIDKTVLTIPIPARTVCVVSGPTPPSGVKLAIGDGLTLGELTGGGQLVVHIPHQDDIRDRFVVEASMPGLSLRTFVEKYYLSFHPTRAALFEFIVPRANGELTVQSVTEDEIGLYFRLPRRVTLAESLRDHESDDTVDGVLPCDALSLEIKPFDPFVALSEAKEQAALKEQNITLASVPGGSPLGRVRLEQESDAFVAVLDRKKGWVKVAYPTEEALAVGWVRKGHVVPGAPKLELQEPSEDTSTPTADGAARRIVVCPHPVPFRGKVGKREVTVGIVHANEVIPVLGSADGRRQIDLANHGLSLEDGAELWAAEADLKGCKEQAP